MNLLHLEKSPYLKQHANNPVHWHAWNNETLLKARQEDKLLLVSIGYSTCHWCHVMEHESFEDQEVANLMNALFICIKVDREERPDVDDYYMDALHLMGQNGGWPLNCVALPNAKPVWGGTYFPKDKWMQILEQLAEIFANDRSRMEEYAVQLNNGLKQLNIISGNAETDFLPKAETEIAWIKQLTAKFDKEFGGMNRAPKFPMPSVYSYLLRYYSFSGQQNVLAHTHFSLQKMASAGLFDQIGGGFSRYSVDAQWFIPHFEKMLYDNGQLLSLYAEAYALEPNERFKEIIDLTVAFIQREITSTEGAFYCGLDADSEGVEGKYYVWNWQEFEALLGNEAAKYQKYWSLTKSGNWEHGNNVLKINENLSEAEIPSAVDLKEISNKLLKYRELRVRPGLDDKVLVSWNCLTIIGLYDAANALKEPLYAAMAQKSLDFIWNTMRDEKGNLYRVYHTGTLSVNAFLEDYALLISALIKAFEFSQNEEYALAANALCEIVLRDFAVNDSPLFYASSSTETGVNVRKVHYQDNVIPSANAVMAENLFTLGHLLLKPKYLVHSKNMLQTVFPFIAKDVEFFSHWAKLHNAMLGNFYEIVVTGPNAAEWMQEIQSWFLPNKVLVLAKENGTLEIAKFKFSNTENRVYLCQEGLCHSPINSLKEVEKAIWS